MSLSFIRHTRLTNLLGIGAIFCGLMGATAKGQQIDLLKYTPLPETNAAPEIQKELRQRVTDFFQLSQDKNYRKALTYVADDTQDVYLSEAKLDIKRFTIKDVHFSADFKRAAVLLDVSRTILIEADVLILPLPMSTSWKIEDGKWMWFRDYTLEQKNPITAMFAKPNEQAPVPKLAEQAPDGSIKLPENFGEGNMIAAATAILSKKGGLDKDTAKLASGQASEDKIVYHNTQPGYVNLELGPVPQIPGLTVALADNQVGPNQDVALVFKYTPPAKVADGPPVQNPIGFDTRVVMQPFQTTFPIHVVFTE